MAESKSKIQASISLGSGSSALLYAYDSKKFYLERTNSLGERILKSSDTHYNLRLVSILQQFTSEFDDMSFGLSRLLEKNRICNQEITERFMYLNQHIRQEKQCIPVMEVRNVKYIRRRKIIDEGCIIGMHYLEHHPERHHDIGCFYVIGIFPAAIVNESIARLQPPKLQPPKKQKMGIEH